MAKERWFTGFEDANGYDLSSSSGDIIADAKWPARSGDYFLSLYGPQGTVPRQTRRPLDNVYTCASTGDQVIARMQVAFRGRMTPLSGVTQLFGFSIGTTVSPNQAASVNQRSDGTLEISASQFSGIGSGWTPTLGTWYVARLHFQYQRNDAGSDPYQVILQVYDGLSLDTATPLLLASAQFVGTFNLTGFQLLGIPCLGSNVARAQIYDFDDWWLSVADGADADLATNPDLAWPAGSRVQAVPITGQAAGTWTGSYLLARDTPNSAVAGNEQTTAVPGASTTFTHQTAAQLGLIPPGQLAAASEVDQAEAPPFSGLPVPEGLSTGASVYCALPQDLTLPVPILQSFTLSAGAGLFNNGVWIRAFTIEWRSDNANLLAFAGPLTPAVFLSATAAPNFLATIQVAFNPATPADRFLDPANPGTSGYRRYGLGLLVTNAYNERGLLNPFTDVLNASGSQTNTTDLETYGGPGGIDAGPWDSLVALISSVTPNGVLPPYANTNPGSRPSSVTFLLSSPRPSGTASSPTSTNLFGNIFQAQSALPATAFPVVAAVKVTCALQRAAGSGTDDILIGTTAYPVATSGTFGGSTRSQFAIDWTPKTAAEFDALVFGARGGAALATTLRLGQCIAEVLTAGPCTKKTTGFGQYQQVAGIFQSNAGFQVIPTPFKPTFVMVKRIGTTATPGSVKAWWMGGTQSWTINTLTPESIAVMLLQDDGFLVGPSNAANGAAATYAYLALADGHEDTVNDAYVVTGSYQRQSSLDPDLTVELPLALLFSATWTPDVVMEFGNTTVKTPDIAAGQSDQFSATGLVATGVTALGDRTFATGSVLSNVGQHVYVAAKFDAAGLLATVFQVGAFAGTGGAQTIPTNFRGELIVLDHPNAAYNGRFRSDQGNVGNNSVPWIGGSVTTTDITAIGDASFDVGAGASVAGQTSYWLAWKRDGSIGNSGNSTLPVPGGSGTDPVPPLGDICAGGGLKLTPGSPNGQGCVQC